MSIYEPQKHICLPPPKDDHFLGTIWQCDECGGYRKLSMPYPGVGRPFKEYWLPISAWRAKRAIKKMSR